jgi:hypothetical protein
MLGFIDDKTPMKTCPCSQALPAAARFRATVIPSAVGSIHTSTLLSAWTFALKRRIASVILSVASGLITCGTGQDISGRGSVGVASPWTHLSLPQHVVNAHYTCDRSIDRSMHKPSLRAQQTRGGFGAQKLVSLCGGYVVVPLLCDVRTSGAQQLQHQLVVGVILKLVCVDKTKVKALCITCCQHRPQRFICRPHPQVNALVHTLRHVDRHHRH